MNVCKFLIKESVDSAAYREECYQF